MPVIKLSAFAGEKPLIADRLLPDTASTGAYNTRLDDGVLTPIRAPQKTGSQAGGTNHKTIIRHNDEWISWPDLVHAVSGPVASDRLYVTGDGAPKLLHQGTPYDLALNRPAIAVTATVSGVGDGDTQSRTYCYTLVTSLGEESAPSPAAELVDWKPGQTVTLSGFGAGQGAGRLITHQRIYRSQTGGSGTYFYLIAERPVSAGNFLDDIEVDGFQEALPSSGWDEPVAGLAGLTAMANGMMAAYSGKTVYFSEPYRPHAWPEAYAMNVDHPIVGLGAIGSSLVVMTTGRPYIMAGSEPSAIASRKLEAQFPCINARSIVDVGYAVCYATNDGLVAVGADGSVRLVTAELFNRDKWQQLSPQTAVAATAWGIYALFYDYADENGQKQQGGLFINPGISPFLSRTQERAVAVWSAPDDGGLYFVRPNDSSIMRFDAPSAPPTAYFWRSKPFWLTQPINLGAILIDLGEGWSPAEVAAQEAQAAQVASENAILFDGELLGALNSHQINEYILDGDVMARPSRAASLTVTVSADDKIIYSTNAAGRIARLPAGFKARKYQVDIAANVQIAAITLANSIDDLRGQ